MNNDLLFRLLIAALFIGFIAHRGYYTKKAGRHGADAIRQRENGAAVKLSNLLNLFALAVTIGYIFAPDLLAWASLPLPSWLRWLGAIIALAGFGLLQWSQVTLGRNWSDRPRLLADQVLVTDGPYRRVRHPIYTAFLLILSAPFFLSANWLIGLLWFASTAIEVASRVRYEETLLAAEFGDDYHAYAARTGRLLPRR
jgi:protein-S-isoprenylcysteine O-methyltransferase Ste14